MTDTLVIPFDDNDRGYSELVRMEVGATHTRLEFKDGSAMVFSELGIRAIGADGSVASVGHHHSAALATS